MAESLLVDFVVDLREVAGHFEVHPLAALQFLTAVTFEPLVEKTHRHAQHLRYLEQPSGEYAVDAALVLVRLLIGNADHFGHLLLAQPQHDPAFADSRSDEAIRIRRPVADFIRGDGVPPFIRSFAQGVFLPVGN